MVMILIMKGNNNLSNFKLLSPSLILLMVLIREFQLIYLNLKIFLYIKFRSLAQDSNLH